MARLVPLRVCYSIPEALCLRAMLAAYGIPSAANALQHASVSWSLLVALGPAVHVFDEHLEDACLLAEPVEEYVNDVESEPSAMWRAPLLAILGIALSILCGIPAPIWITKRRFLSEKA